MPFALLAQRHWKDDRFYTSIGVGNGFALTMKCTPNCGGFKVDEASVLSHLKATYDEDKVNAWWETDVSSDRAIYVSELSGVYLQMWRDAKNFIEQHGENW